jgi:hypothetical protein
MSRMKSLNGVRYPRDPEAVKRTQMLPGRTRCRGPDATFLSHDDRPRDGHGERYRASLEGGGTCSFGNTPMSVEALLALDEVAERTGQPVRRLRQWCATGSLRCERDGRGWLIPEGELSRVVANAAARALLASTRMARALVVPNGSVGSVDLREEVAHRLQQPQGTVSMNTLMIDGQEYVIATWPVADGGTATSAVAELAEELGGELLA